MVFVEEKAPTGLISAAHRRMRATCGIAVENFFREEEALSVSVEEHIGLALKCASFYSNSRSAIQDSEEYSIALIGLWDATATYDPKINGKFSTYAWKCMKNRIFDMYKFNNRKKRNVPLISISQLENFDILEEESESESDEILNFDIDQILDCDEFNEEKSQRDRKILEMRFLENKSWQEIGDFFNMTKAGARHCAFALIDRIRFKIYKD